MEINSSIQSDTFDEDQSLVTFSSYPIAKWGDHDKKRDQTQEEKSCFGYCCDILGPQNLPSFSQKHAFSFAQTILGPSIERPWLRRLVIWLYCALIFGYFLAIIPFIVVATKHSILFAKTTFIQAIVSLSFYFVLTQATYFQKFDKRQDLESSKIYEWIFLGLTAVWWSFEVFLYGFGKIDMFNNKIDQFIFFSVTWGMSLVWITTVWYLYLSYLWAGNRQANDLSDFCKQINSLTSHSRPEEFNPPLDTQFLEKCKLIQESSKNFQGYALYVVLWSTTSMLIWSSVFGKETILKNEDELGSNTAVIYFYSAIVYFIWFLLAVPSIRTNAWIMEIKARCYSQFHRPNLNVDIRKMIERIFPLLQVEVFRPQVFGVTLSGDFFTKVTGIFFAIVVFAARFNN